MTSLDRRDYSVRLDCIAMDVLQVYGLGVS